MSLQADFLGAFEVHSPAGIRAALAAGASPTALINGKTPIDALIEGYLRSPAFAECLQVLLDAGATLDDPWLAAILQDDAPALQRLLRGVEQDVNRRFTLPCAFTACDGVTALHVCAEFNGVQCAGVLIAAGADVNARADTDDHGFGGQTPIFHAVNSIFNYCRPMLDLLVDAGADLDVRLKAVRWGPGADWETLVLDVTPISYAQCGLYPQFQRRERDVYANLAYLHLKKCGEALPVRNVPNRYLTPRS
jgi:Ankyrin repeat